LTVAHITTGNIDISLFTNLAEGDHTLTARLVDQAGNLGGVSGTMVALNIDTMAPAQPVIHAVTGDDTLNASEQSAMLSGTAEAGATLGLTLGAGNVRSVVVNANGSWSYFLTAADIAAMGHGDVTINATATDAVGNASARAGRAIVVDVIVPTSKATLTDADDNISPTTGNVVSGGTTNDNTLVLSGALDIALPNHKVVVFDGSTRLGETSVSGSTWSFTTPALSNAAHSLTAVVEDPAGNQGSVSTPYAVNVNATVPAATSL
jgi:hypothetical protein